MPGIRYLLPNNYASYLRASQRNGFSIQPRPVRPLHSSPSQSQNPIDSSKPQKPLLSPPNTQLDGEERGAMSMRLLQATENALLEGGKTGRTAVEEAGFSEELKQKLLERVEAQKFRLENSAAFSQAGMKSNVGRGSQDIASAQSWTGEEAQADTILRMLDDSRKPSKPRLRRPSKIPNPIDLRPKGELKLRPGQRLANARDKTSIYAISKDTQMSDEERAAMRQELKDRFSPGARAMPNSLRGLAALANERIEDAIARGQFKNIPRGKAIERDARADNPFLDTTEYIMNKMIQRQDIVPPWIEKQQELIKTANVFRARLRNDWKRHAARTIASRGGSLQEQIRWADLYAKAERVQNPKKRAVEEVSLLTTATDNPAMVKIIQAPTTSDVSIQVTLGKDITTTAPQLTGVANLAPQASKDHSITQTLKHSNVNAPNQTSNPSQILDTQIVTPAQSSQISHQHHLSTRIGLSPLPPPFRLPEWEAAEKSYLNLAITNLNNLTRSYNLMAPELAKKPYFSLERELKSCYADIAPQLSTEIKERAARPPRDLIEKIGHRPGGILERFGGDTANIYDSKRPSYGFKELWNDLFREKRT